MDEALTRATDALVSAMGRQSAFWGLGKTAGEMYAVLYVSGAPLSLAEVARQLQVTKGNISVAIRQLEQLGMVRRSWRKGDRRVFFEAETDFWKIGRSVLALRHKPEFDQSFALVAQSAQFAADAGPSPERDTVVTRVAALQQFYRLLDSVVETSLGLSPQQLRAMIEMFKVVSEGDGRGDR